MRSKKNFSLAAIVLAVIVVMLLAWDRGAPASMPADGLHTGGAADMQTFWHHWGDGNGEIATYATTQSRYGELRNGETVLVFVTEEISRTTRIKVESDRIAAADRVPVIKLNRNVKFPTGIYDYALMTSTFSAVGSELGMHPFQAMKVSHTMQEWCGNYFGMCITMRDELQYSRDSYFEAEGDSISVRIPLPNQQWEYEDNLPILIRELGGEWMRDGETRSIKLFPTFQHQRFMHTPVGFVDATISKQPGGAVKIGDATIAATTAWSWSYADAKGAVKETYVTDNVYPHHILSWKSGDGSSGTMLAVRRLPYWNEHDNASAHLRKELGLKGL